MSTEQPEKTSFERSHEQARRLALQIATAAMEKKAASLEILDVRRHVDYTDFLVLMMGHSDRQVAALVYGIEEALRKKNKKIHCSVEGLPHAYWVIMDFGDVVAHLFQQQAHQLYDLEGLWMDAQRIKLPKDKEEQGKNAA
ncbi:ribosome silencing factor [Pajaroellobacter abortibovis]|uniref:Ribosomal silencing factor RsfS n=1 Tax=Pajaroellobacter abortibovis TaxID=1882918 RepID=A0A1L6MZ65_9BACT|nr:ribosome silencing factor [Pajaroellobacter abortibovis]